MKELSLHILDIVQNSIKADAKNIEINIDENTVENKLSITIKDNGCGMNEEFLKNVRDPFTTTRTTRKIGMGISLFEAAAKQCGGGLDITSELNVGTVVTAHFEYDNIDRAPIGDMAATMVTIISGSPEIEFIYSHTHNGKSFLLNTIEIRSILGDVPLNTSEVISWINEYISEGLAEINT